MTMRLRSVLALAMALLFAALSAHAQMRTIPQEARRGELRHLGQSIVEINGNQMPLAAGAQIRDAENRIVLPTALPPWSLVRYLANAEGFVTRVWILTPTEAAQPDRTQ